MNKNIKYLLICSILIHSGANLLAPIYAIYIKKIGGNLIDAGIAIGIYAIFKGIFYFVLSKLDESKLSKRVMMFSGYIIMAIAYLSYTFANSPAHVFAIQIGLSLGETIINPSWSAVIASSLKKGKEHSIYANFFGYRSLFEGISAIVGGFFAMRFGFNVIFTIMFFLALSSGIIALLIDEKTILKKT
ncbi:hypothetical protein CXF68_16430 [Tenacibaculum sp. Bg11-29]|uniref:MFS transporter n=1 Tax=Tenacibaculum sp. Bg11-29 TaxID=2058306 RepID=UPI000C33B8F3|nr:MFS transporter [Tenacibaculum sp. Bg11-29]PKH52181.1 hypothetical protein CXF68_16430 [Tenacibaculum sp. Bg11-29]